MTAPDIELLMPFAIEWEKRDGVTNLVRTERVSDSLCAGVWFTSSPRIGRGKPRLVG